MENIEIISKDGFKMFIPSDHPLLNKKFFRTITNNRVPLEHKLLKQLFFNYHIQNNSSELIEIVKFTLPLNSGIEKKFIKDLFNLTNFLYVKVNKKKIIKSLNDNWNFEDLNTAMSKYVKRKYNYDTNRERESDYLEYFP